MATCFKRQIQTSADISPMCSKIITLPHWPLMKGGTDFLVGVARPSWRIPICQVWCGVVLPNDEASEMPSTTYASGLVVPAVSHWMLHMVASTCVARHIHRSAVSLANMHCQWEASRRSEESASSPQSSLRMPLSLNPADLDPGSWRPENCIRTRGHHTSGSAPSPAPKSHPGRSLCCVDCG